MSASFNEIDRECIGLLMSHVLTHKDICNVYHVSAPTVSSWIRRHPDTFPLPVWTFGNGMSIYDMGEIRDWVAGHMGGKKRTGKTPAKKPAIHWTNTDNKWIACNNTSANVETTVFWPDVTCKKCRDTTLWKSEQLWDVTGIHTQ